MEFNSAFKGLTLLATEDPFTFQNTSTALRQARNIKITGAKVCLFFHFEGKLTIQCYSCVLEHVFAQLYFNPYPANVGNMVSS
jgi:hypothetical protein